MKKLIASVVIAVAVILAVIVFITKHAAHASRVAELLPAETIAFFHLPDINRSRERWPKTALYQIAHEPEVLAFLERPKTKIPQREEIQKRTAQVEHIDPREAFLAVTAIDDKNVPKVVAGFSYRGKKTDVDALLADLRKSVQEAWPAGKSDILKSGGDEIETFTNGSVTAAAAFKEDWLLVADDVDLLKSTLARFDGQKTNSLRDNANFLTTISHMPMDFDALSFVQMQAVADRLTSWIMMANPNTDPHAMDEFKKIQALAAAMKFEGENMHDTTFVMKSGEEKKEPMGRSGLALTSTNTLVYYAASLQKPANFQMPNTSALDALGYMRFVQPFLDSFAAQGLTADDFWTAFGPEMNVVTDWAATAQIPAPLVALDVHDKAKAQSFVDALTQAKTGTAWARQMIDGTPFYQLPSSGIGTIQIAPTIALTDKFVLIGLNLDALKAALARANSNEPKLEKVPVFRKAADAVHAPTAAFGFVDARSLFERIYGPLRPFIMMWATFAKGSGDYVDVSKLPATETISKHLGPIVYSQSAVANGMISESVGPVTMTQAMIGFGAGVGAAAVPILQKQFAPQPSVPSVSPNNATPSPRPSLQMATPAATPGADTTPAPSITP